ncbi:MAG: galactokinase [Acidimicrobiales bacterium]|jgi:galactokinase|nr:galactokinase [Acidimicrobiales bacterium]
MTVHAYAPGRVNLIGDHTDYAGGLAVPMAIDLGTSVVGEPGGERIVLHSEQLDGLVELPLRPEDPAAVEPTWGRYVAGVAAELQPDVGFTGVVRSTVPVGSGLSSSAALELATALALGFRGPARELAALCQRAEQRASGVPCGIMDQLTSACGVADHALVIDFTTLAVERVPVPAGAEVVVVHSGEARALAGSAYADRRAQVEAAAALIGSLHDADPGDLERVDDPLVRRRARHVLTENARVRAFAEAFSSGDLIGAGRLMAQSHASLRDDFEVSTPTLDALVERLCATTGVHGARLTGAGFGGCVVALTDPGTLDEGWTVRASAGATRLNPASPPAGTRRRGA